MSHEPTPLTTSAPRALALVLCLLSASPVRAMQDRDAERLEQATKLVRERAEAQLREGALLCARIDSAASMELLLDVLNADNPHRRDVVWEALPLFEDPYARERVATELAQNRRNELTRQWCAQLLGLYGDETHVRVLEKALRDREPGVRAAAAQALGRIGHVGSPGALAKLHKDKDAATRAYAREAAARLDPEQHAPLLHAGLADKDAGVRCFLLGCVPGILPEEAEALSIRGLSDVDWRVRLQAAENLASIRTRTSVDALIEASEDPRPVVALTVGRSLAELTNKGWTRPEQWRDWWAQEREGFDLEHPPEKKQVQGEGVSSAVRYNDLPIDTDHAAFLIDVSNGMRAQLESREGSKAEEAYGELERVLGLLAGRLVFNVYAYDTLAIPFAKKSVELDARAVKKALAFVEDANARGPKDIWNALQTALADTELDTIYLLASGEPEIGLYVHHNRIAQHLREQQRFHKVVVHGVAFTDSDWYSDQIEEICRATGGEFRRVR